MSALAPSCADRWASRFSRIVARAVFPILSLPLVAATAHASEDPTTFGPATLPTAGADAATGNVHASLTLDIPPPFVSVPGLPQEVMSTPLFSVDPGIGQNPETDEWYHRNWGISALGNWYGRGRQDLLYTPRIDVRDNGAFRLKRTRRFLPRWMATAFQI
jgi:hypothetical protein